MKKVLSLVLVLCMVFSLCACGNSASKGGADYKVAMITDYGDITDQSFNQTTRQPMKLARNSARTTDLNSHTISPPVTIRQTV